MAMRPDLFENAPTVQRSCSTLRSSCMYILNRHLLELGNPALPVADDSAGGTASLPDRLRDEVYLADIF